MITKVSISLIMKNSSKPFIRQLQIDGNEISGVPPRLLRCSLIFELTLLLVVTAIVLNDKIRY